MIENFRIPNYGYYRSILIEDKSINKNESVHKYFDLNFDYLLTNFRLQKPRKPILFIGAGFSIASNIKDWTSSIKYIHHRYKDFVESQKAKYLIARGNIEQADKLVQNKKINDPEYMIDLIEFFKFQFRGFPEGIQQWRTILEELYLVDHTLSMKYKPNDNHQLISEIFNDVGCLITTNFDSLIEDSIEENSSRFGYTFDRNSQVFKYYEYNELQRYITNNPDGRFILKLHGCVNDLDVWSNIIFGRKDYVNLMINHAEIFKVISNIYKYNFPILICIGSSLGDRDVLNLIAYMSKEQGSINNVAIAGVDLDELINNRDIIINERNSNWMYTNLYNTFALPYPVSSSFKNKFINFNTAVQSLVNFFNKYNQT